MVLNKVGLSFIQAVLLKTNGSTPMTSVCQDATTHFWQPQQSIYQPWISKVWCTTTQAKWMSLTTAHIMHPNDLNHFPLNDQQFNHIHFKQDQHLHRRHQHQHLRRRHQHQHLNQLNRNMNPQSTARSGMIIQLFKNLPSGLWMSMILIRMAP